MTPEQNNPKETDKVRQWEEYRRRKIHVQRQAVRRVKYSLLTIAILAALWYMYLVFRDSYLFPAAPDSPPPASASDPGERP